MTVSSPLDHLMAALDRPLAPLPFDQTTPIAIYGAGGVGKDSCKALLEAGFTVRCFLDRQARPGAEWQGIPILNPDAPQLAAAERRTMPLVIAIFNRAVDIPTLLDTLESLGYTKIVSFLEFYNHFDQQLGERFWLTGREHYRQQATHILAAANLWEDETSRQLYWAALDLRLRANYGEQSQPDFENQYFPADLPAWPGPMRFVDCGAYNGDSLGHLKKAYPNVEAIAAFEPEQENFLKLARYVRLQGDALASQVYLWPCGVHSGAEQLRFASGEGEGSHASLNGLTVIQGVSLDEALPTFKPTLIKMDIEGAEYDALLGARETIRANRPGLAICLYHRPDHLWQLPLLVSEWEYGYKFYLRSHGFNGFDLVMYALPK